LSSRSRPTKLASGAGSVFRRRIDARFEHNTLLAFSVLLISYSGVLRPRAWSRFMPSAGLPELIAACTRARASVNQARRRSASVEPPAANRPLAAYDRTRLRVVDEKEDRVLSLNCAVVDRKRHFLNVGAVALVTPEIQICAYLNLPHEGSATAPRRSRSGATAVPRLCHDCVA
jgi:hypothetical protein